MLASDDEELIETARFLSQQARDRAPHYEHSQLGYNYRMSNILAAIGRGQLRALDERVEAKRRIFKYYRNALEALTGIEFMPEASYGQCSRWLTVVQITPEELGVDRETLRLALEAENIESRPVWKPMHLQPVFDVGSFQDISHKGGELSLSQNVSPRSSSQLVRYKARVAGGKVSEELFAKGLCLPSGTQMSEEDLDRVLAVLKRVIP